MPNPVLTPIDGKVVFLCGDGAITGRDLLDAALFRGELQPEWQNLLRLLAAERRADEEGREPEDDAIDRAAEQFRYQHDLITAEETEQWLSERGLTLGDFSAHFVRHYWGEQWQDLAPEQLEYLSAPNELHKLLVHDLLLSGELDQIALRTSWRLAAQCAADRAVPEAGRLAEERAAFLARVGRRETDLPAWLERLGRDQTWLEEALALEAIFHRTQDSLLSRQAREHEIAALRIPLTRFEVETIELDSLDAAREALLCARDDGMTMEEVAAEGRYPYRHPELLLEEIPEELQQKFLSVNPGDILEPIVHGEGFHLCRVVGKAEPDLDDPLVKERADQRILDRHFGDLSTRYIQWRTLLA